MARLNNRDYTKCPKCGKPIDGYCPQCDSKSLYKEDKNISPIKRSRREQRNRIFGRRKR